MPAWNKISFPERELRRLYINKKLSIFQISKSFGCSTGPIHRSLREYKIPIRSLSEACTRVPVSKKQLQKWYWKDKMSMFEIADKLKCTHSAIVHKFNKLRIKSRGHLGLTKPIKLGKGNFEYLYYKRRLSLNKIAKIVHCSESGIERRFNNYNILTRGIKNRACKYKKRDFSGNSIEKAYLIGFRLGDLNVMKRVSVILVRCSTTIPAQTRLIRNLFKPYTTPHVWKAKRGTTEIACLVNRSFDFLLPKEDKISPWILTNDKAFWAFFAGYADAEGCFYIHKASKGKFDTSRFEIETQQKEIINGLWKGIQTYKIFTPIPRISRMAGSIDKRGVINNKDTWKLNINRKSSLNEFIRLIEPYIKHANKIKKIGGIKENLVLRGV